MPEWLRRITPANLFFVLLNLVGVAAFLFPLWAPTQPSSATDRTALLIFSGAVALLLLALISEAQTGLTIHTIAIIGTLVGLNTVFRLIETMIPLPGGFSPVFLLIILVGYSFGARLGFLMGALTMLVSGPLTIGGLGPWTPYQMLAAGWVGMGAALLPKGKMVLPSLVIYATLWGWLYGALTSMYFWPYAISAPDIGWEPGLGPLETLIRYGRYYLVSSFIWDSARSIGNFILMLILGSSLVKALDRFKRRARVTWETA
ncbi:MAG: ECF transporter S component [Anaerolineales bacterium]|nr:ECF transporter S component [Anaerolineales bacterium]